MAAVKADLQALSVVRSERNPERKLDLPRNWWSRVVFPGSLLLGFAGLMVWASWESLVPALAVQVTPVLLQTGQEEVAGQELFKANGWIEPRPLPIDVPVQAEGMYRVTEVKITAGERVKAGQLLIALDDTKAKLDLESALAKSLRKAAALRSAQADVSKAHVALANARIGVGLAKKEGDADVLALQAEVDKAETAGKSADLAVQQEEHLLSSGVNTSDIKLRLAKQQREVAKSEVGNMRAKLSKGQSGAEVKVRQAETLLAAAEAEVTNLAAKVEEAVQEGAEAEVEVRKAKLELERTKLHAPVDGVVMQLNVRVGSMTGGKVTYPEHKDAAITLYDPKKLQVRVEVPINKFQFVRNGQPAIVELEDVLPGKKLTGNVLTDTHQANIARNSVPVKVALPDNPPEALRPDMIASVRFLSLAPATPTRTQKTVQRLEVPRKLVQTSGDAQMIWVVNQLTMKAELRTIQLAGGEKEKQSDWAEVSQGLQPSDKLIATPLDQLSPGRRVKISGEAQ